MEYQDVMQQRLLMVYLSDLGKQVMEMSEEIYADGTFATAPKGFCQIYFLMGKIKNKRPLLFGFALLPDKETETYEKLVEVLKVTIDVDNIKMVRLMVDFEKAVWKAFRKHFPSVTIVGCNFHHIKAIRKHIADNGLKSLYGHCTEFQYLVKLILALTYVPEAKVQVAFDTVVQAQYKRLQEEDIYDDYEVQLISFMAYITRTWIGRGTGPQRKKPMFPIQSWNKHEDVIMDKLLTNNVVETYNANWTDTMERTPSLYSVIEGFNRQVC